MLDGIRVLVVDDDESQSEMYIAALELFGAEVAPATSVDEAIEALATQRFDVVVSDVGLPERGGYDLARELRQAGVTLPAVALTGWIEPGGREVALAAGFDEFFTKPCSLLELASTIARLVGRVSSGKG